MNGRYPYFLTVVGQFLKIIWVLGQFQNHSRSDNFFVSLFIKIFDVYINIVYTGLISDVSAQKE